jgi:hypothetical protein
MQHLQHAFRFIGASLKLASKNQQFRRSMLYLRAGSLVLLFVGFIPIALVVWLVGFTPLGLILIGLLSFLFTASLLVWGEIGSINICPEAARLFHDPAQDFSPPEKPLKNHWGDIFVLALSIPGAAISNFLRKLLKPKAQTLGWFDGHILILPIISLEDLKLPDAIRRVEQMLNDNLLRIQPNLVPVRLVAWVVRLVLIVIGILLGILFAVSIVSPLTSDPWQRILAVGTGLLSAWLFAALGVLFSAFTRVCYHTSLYIWARNIEQSRNGNVSVKTSPPEILRQVLGSEK